MFFRSWLELLSLTFFLRDHPLFHINHPVLDLHREVMLTPFSLFTYSATVSGSHQKERCLKILQLPSIGMLTSPFSILPLTSCPRLQIGKGRLRGKICVKVPVAFHCFQGSEVKITYLCTSLVNTRVFPLENIIALWNRKGH